jgi:UrcA family protein
MTMRAKILLMAGAMGFMAVATSAGAQDTGYYGSAPYSGPQEEVIVTPPPYGPRVGHLGGPIENVSLSRPVRYDDLDLSSHWGAHRLRERVSFEARELCKQLDAMYPVSADDSSGWNNRCYDRAFEQAMYQADRVIAEARNGNGEGYYGNSGP